MTNRNRTGDHEPLLAALTSELPSSRNTFSRPRAYATAAPRAPDGPAPFRSREPAPQETVRIMLRIGVSSKTPILFARSRFIDMHRPPPVPGIRAQRIVLLNSCASQWEPPCPRAFLARMLRMRMIVRNSLTPMRIPPQKPAHPCADCLIANAQKKTPPGFESEGVRVPRRSGDRSPRGKISRWE